MVAIIAVTDLPAALQSADLVQTMVDGANARATRVAPCLADPTTTAWATATDYAVDDQVVLTGGEFLQATIAGTSGASEPTAPTNVGEEVDDGTVTWKRIAPTPDQITEAKLVLIGAVKRWIEAGAGSVSQQTAGPFSMMLDTRQKTSGFNFWPSEIEALQAICALGTESSSGAFSITPGGSTVTHLPWCSINFGATYCSCGADLAGYPLYEGGALSGDYW